MIHSKYYCAVQLQLHSGVAQKYQRWIPSSTYYCVVQLQLRSYDAQKYQRRVMAREARDL